MTLYAVRNILVTCCISYKQEFWERQVGGSKHLACGKTYFSSFLWQAITSKYLLIMSDNIATEVSNEVLLVSSHCPRRPSFSKVVKTLLAKPLKMPGGRNLLAQGPVLHQNPTFSISPVSVVFLSPNVNFLTSQRMSAVGALSVEHHAQYTKTSGCSIFRVYLKGEYRIP